MRLRDTVTRLRGSPGGGPYGGGDLDWTSPASADYAAEVFNPSSFEDLQAGDEITTRFVVQTYPEADVTGRDRVVWRGATYEIVSDVEPLSMHGRVRSLRFVIQRVQGG
jgi:hypothetical protein